MILLGLIGAPGSGKSHSAKYLVGHHGFVELTFASPIKRFLAQMFPEHIEAIYGSSSHRDKPLSDAETLTARDLLDSMGKIIRVVDDHALVRFAMQSLDVMSNINGEHFVFSDVRRMSEMDALRRRGGKIVRLTRGHFKSKQMGTELMMLPVDFEIDNKNMTVPELETALRHVVLKAQNP